LSTPSYRLAFANQIKVNGMNTTRDGRTRDAWPLSPSPWSTRKDWLNISMVSNIWKTKVLADKSFIL